MINKLSLLFLILGIIFTAIGGYLDISNKSKLMGISKEHFWNDGTVFILLAIFTILVYKS